MKRHSIINTNGGLIVSVLFSFCLVCCNQIDKSNRDKTINEEKDPQMIAIKQNKDNLLNDVSKAVCYSGFRSGQHPDRGEGAINPSEEEILEDLIIISRDCDFKLIRLYDCGNNSENVLKLISENNLNIKVMLGIWLNAELSNHETCEWLTEPIPQEILNNNTISNREEIEKGIALAIKYPHVVGSVNVGNEALVEWNDHAVDVDTIISYVKQS